MSRRRKLPLPPVAQAPRAFIDFFEGEWQRRLGRVKIPHMDDASWDRRAAWLLWKAEKHDRDAEG